MANEYLPKVSVLIPAYNMARFLGTAIESALSDPYPNLEVVVVDDGSTDETRTVAGSFPERVRYFSQENHGVSAALNRCLEYAEGEFVRLLAADDAMGQDSVGEQVELFRRNQRLGLVFGQAQSMDEFGEVLPGVIRPIGSSAKTPLHLPSEKAFRWLLGGCHVVCGTVLMRREAVDRAGPFQVRSVPGEDWDMFLRIAAHYDFAFIPRPLAYYRVHGGSMTASFNIDKVKAAHDYTLSQLYARSDLPYRDSEVFAYACNDRTLAQLAAYMRDTRLSMAYLFRAVRRSPSLMIEGDTWKAALQTTKSALPERVVSSLRSLRRAGRYSPSSTT